MVFLPLDVSVKSSVINLLLTASELNPFSRRNIARNGYTIDENVDPFIINPKDNDKHFKISLRTNC